MQGNKGKVQQAKGNLPVLDIVGREKRTEGTAAAMAEAGKKTKKAGRKAKRPAQQQKQQQGHYADPMSPIASTPMKRQRTKSAGASRVVGVDWWGERDVVPDW